MLFAIIILNIFISCFGAYIANSKGYPAIGWFLICLIFGLIGFVILLALPETATQQAINLNKQATERNKLVQVKEKAAETFSKATHVVINEDDLFEKINSSRVIKKLKFGDPVYYRESKKDLYFDLYYYIETIDGINGWYLANNLRKI